MIKKTLILSLIAISLLLISTIPTVAEQGSISDPENDVIETDPVTSETSEVSTKPNLDITKVSYDRSGQMVTLTLTVKGNIENNGDIEVWKLLYDNDYYEEKLAEFEGDEDLLLEYMFALDWNLTTYQMDLFTIENQYTIIFVNQEILIVDYYSEGLIDGDFEVNGDDLAVSFELIDDGDRLGNVSVMTTELMGLEGASYDDELFGECTDTEPVNNDDEEDEDDDDNSGTGVIVLVVVIALLVVAIAAVTYFIRR